MAKLRAEQLAALQMFSDDSDDDEEPDTAKDTQMEPEPDNAAEGSSEKPVLPVKETGKTFIRTSAILLYLLIGCSWLWQYFQEEI